MADNSEMVAVPEDLIFQAKLDLLEDYFWRGKRASFRRTLRRFVLRYQMGHGLTRKDLTSTFNIVYFNDELRTTPRPSYDPDRFVTLWQLPADEAAAALEAAMNTPGTDGAPVPHSEPEAPPVAPPAPEAPPPPPRFNPPLTASAIARGWGFASSTIVARFQEQCPDFPAPLPGDRQAPMWAYLDVAAWTTLHQADIDKARRRAVGQNGLHTRMRELEAENATLRSRLGAQG